MKLLSFASFFYYLFSFCRDGGSVVCPVATLPREPEDEAAGRQGVSFFHSGQERHFYLLTFERV
jgi:hypothetical protein